GPGLGPGSDSRPPDRPVDPAPRRAIGCGRMGALTTQDLAAIERRGWDALCDQSGGSFYGSLMTDDALMVLVNGAVLSRAEVVASFDHGPAWDSYELADIRRVDLGPQAAGLVYRATARRGEEPPFEAAMSSTYVLVDGSP